MEQTQAPETREARPRRIRLHHPGRFKTFALSLMCATFAVFGALVMVALAHTPKVNNELHANNSTTTTGGDSSTTAAIITGTGVTEQVPTLEEKVPHQEEEKGHVLPEVTAQTTTTLYTDDDNNTIVFTTYEPKVSVVIEDDAASV
ncbi:hypothetical protein CFIO01_10685 [Colletotrichum fioriniae PJ7]|uniref:Uncharacterized protein n=1 Tax=Colletotrichum fioriniae PJ7 TaxID=1445577 RepID=A0A010R3T6_9PEZI|nr:hypothetical protein CFIO01_10685 [Colletotrichum fioriniae PJ7]